MSETQSEDSSALPPPAPGDVDALTAAQAEIAALRARVRELEDRHKAQEQQLQNQPNHIASAQLLRQIIDNCPSYIFVKDTELRYLLISRPLESFYRTTSESVIGKTDYDFWPGPIAEAMRNNDREVMVAKVPLEREEETEQPDGRHTYLSLKFPVFDQQGALVGVCGISTDITARKESAAERERLARQQQIIEAQQLALRELNTPLIPLAEGVVVMPLIGHIDSGRAKQILEVLLEGVARLVSKSAIVDITGVRVIDAQVASVLLQAARAVRLLGAQVILTGISAPMAQALVEQGADLSDIVTHSTLQSGIAHALRQRETRLR